MGKFPHSKLHGAFSDWHYRKCKPSAFLCDIDRIWVEIREGKPIAVFDLKLEGDTLTHAGKILGEWFELNEIPFYIVQVKLQDVGQKTFRNFICYRPKTDELIERNEDRMIEWINRDFKVV